MRELRPPFSIGQKVKALEGDLAHLTFRVLAILFDGHKWSCQVSDAEMGGFWQFSADQLKYADLAEEQDEMAKWLGCSVEQMNKDHDALHKWLSDRTGCTSHSLRLANGEPLNEQEVHLAVLEEDAVLAVQRYLSHCRRLRETPEG